MMKKPSYWQLLIVKSINPLDNQALSLSLRRSWIKKVALRKVKIPDLRLLNSNVSILFYIS